MQAVTTRHCLTHPYVFDSGIPAFKYDALCILGERGKIHILFPIAVEQFQEGFLLEEVRAFVFILAVHGLDCEGLFFQPRNAQGSFKR